MIDEAKRIRELADAVKICVEDNHYYTAISYAKEIILQCQIAIKEGAEWTQK